MGKEFIEYFNIKGTIPYSASTLCFCLTRYAKEYISSDRNLISNIDTKIRDAVLVDFINYLGMNGGIDFALYTYNLYDNRIEDEYVDPQCILTAVPNHCACYIFNEGIVDSVLMNKHMNECTKSFDVNDGIKVLLDFINYIAEKNDFDRIFTINELHEKAQIQNYKKEQNKLKSFLQHVSLYSEKLESGKNIDLIFDEMALKHDLKYISKRGRYYYTDDIKDLVEQSEMFSFDVDDIEKEIYAMAYAYEKTKSDNKTKPKTDIIRKKIREMKKR